MSQLHNHRFNALRSALYHKARHKRLDTWSRASNFLVIALGTAAMAKASGVLGLTVQNWEISVGAATSIVGALKLVYDWSAELETHEILQKKYFDICAELSHCQENDTKSLQEIDEQLLKTYGEEPPVLRALDSIAYNQARDALGSPNGRDDNLMISFWQNFAKHFWAFESTHFCTYIEHRQEKEKLMTPDKRSVGTAPPPSPPKPSPDGEAK